MVDLEGIFEGYQRNNSNENTEDKEALVDADALRYLIESGGRL